MVLLRKIKSSLKIALKDIEYVFGNGDFTLKNMDYDEYWNMKGGSGIKERFRMFAQYIDEGGSVLDIGCGDGTCLSYLMEEKKISGEGIDISTKAIKVANEKGIHAWKEDIRSDGFSLAKEYDHIIMSEVLEHIAEPENVLYAVKDHFRKTLLVTFPNVGYYRHRMRLLFGRFPVQWAFHPGEHLRFWTVRDFEGWVRSLGYRLVDLQSTNGLPMMYSHYPGLFGHQILAVLTK